MPSHGRGGRPLVSWHNRNIEIFPVNPTRPKQLQAPYAAFIDYLCEVESLGYSVIYPLSENKTEKNQWVGLHLAARNRGLKVKVKKLDAYRLKVTFASWSIDENRKKRILWEEHFTKEDVELAPAVEISSFIHDDDHEGYAPFIDKLEQCGPLGYGVLYKLRETKFGCTEALQRAGLYTAARRRKVWISIDKLDSHTLRVYWKGSDPYASEHHRGVRRQHVKTDDESMAARLARVAEKQGL